MLIVLCIHFIYFFILSTFCVIVCFLMIHSVCSNILVNRFNNQLLPIIIIIVRLLFIILILEMYSRYFDPQIGQHHQQLRVNKHYTV
jgi:hypothetical protein